MDDAMTREPEQSVARARHTTERSRVVGPHALLSGGGSGGHVFPGLAIAEELERRGWRVSWAGSSRGIEARLVNERRIPFHALPARPVVGQGLIGKLRAATTLTRSAWRARSLVRRLEARVVVGTGGYVSAPAVVGARLAARPAFLLEPNAEAGTANRWLSRFVAEAAVAFDATRSQLRCPSVTTGVPVREAFFAAAGELPAGPPWRVLVLGGSQGARQVNEMIPEALGLLSSNVGEVVVCHQTGEGHVESTREAYRAAGLSSSENQGGGAASGAGFEVVSFLDDMAGAMARSHLVISRAGAITLAEICATGRPSVLLPLALAGAHQVSNAQRLAEDGAAEVVPPEATVDSLAQLLASLLSDRDKLRGMALAARGLGRAGAAQHIADRVERLGMPRSGARRGEGEAR